MVAALLFRNRPFPFCRSRLSVARRPESRRHGRHHPQKWSYLWKNRNSSLSWPPSLARRGNPLPRLLRRRTSRRRGTRQRNPLFSLLGMAASCCRVGPKNCPLGKCPWGAFHPQRCRLLQIRGRAFRPRVWRRMACSGLPVHQSGPLANGHPAASASSLACRSG